MNLLNVAFVDNVAGNLGGDHVRTCSSCTHYVVDTTFTPFTGVDDTAVSLLGPEATCEIPCTLGETCSCVVGEYCSVTNSGGSSGSCMACPSSSDDGECGCTDVLADNFNPAATILDTSCEYQALCDESDWTCYPASVPAACAASCSPSDFEPQTTMNTMK